MITTLKVQPCSNAGFKVHRTVMIRLPTSGPCLVWSPRLIRGSRFRGSKGKIMTGNVLGDHPGVAHARLSMISPRIFGDGHPHLKSARLRCTCPNPLIFYLLQAQLMPLDGAITTAAEPENLRPEQIIGRMDIFCGCPNAV